MKINSEDNSVLEKSLYLRIIPIRELELSLIIKCIVVGAIRRRATVLMVFNPAHLSIQ